MRTIGQVLADADGPRAVREALVAKGILPDVRPAWVAFRPKAWLRDTEGLSPSEKGVLIDIRALTWRDGSLAEDMFARSYRGTIWEADARCAVEQLDTLGLISRGGGWLHDDVALKQWMRSAESIREWKRRRDAESGQ